MAVQLKYIICVLLIEMAAGQYGPLPSKTHHRTTTTTETPDAANEVLPPSPYQPPPGYKPPAPPSQQPSPSYPSQPQQPSPSGQPPPQPSQQPSPQPSPTFPSSPQPQPTPSGYPKSQHPTPTSGKPSPQYPTSSGQPQFPSPSSHPPSQYPTPGQPTPQYPPPSGQPAPQYPTPGTGQPSPQYPSPSGQPSPQYPTPSGQPSPQYPTPSGQPSPQYPTPSGQPSSQYPTPSGQPSPQYPTPSGQPSPQYPTPSGQPSPQYPAPSGQPQVPFPSNKPLSQYPTPSGQPTPQHPTPGSGQPSPQHPTPSGQPQFPSPSSQPSSQYPTPTGQPAPQYPPPQPGQTFQQFPSPSGQPSPPFPSATGQPSSPSKPQYPIPPGTQQGPRPSPSQQYWWANSQSPFKPGASPPSAAPPAPLQNPAANPPSSGCSPNLANNPFIAGSQPKPQEQGLGPENRPGFPPQPQQPLTSPSRPQPGYGQPTPSQQFQPQPSSLQQGPKPQSGSFPNPQILPISAGPTQNPINPNNPFLNNGLQNPIRQESGGVICTDAAYCVPSYLCNNGIVTDSTRTPANLKKGPCGPSEVCCKVKKPVGLPPSYPTSPTNVGQPQPYGVTESPKYTGPLNTTPYPGCPAALKCVDVSYCTVEGVMSATPVALTREQIENRVPLTDCQDMNTGAFGKCCRDPNYKDPWPAGMMMPAGPKDHDDGQYHPPSENQYDDGQYHPSPEQGEREYTTLPPPNSHTIKLPIGVFKQKVTPFPIFYKPGQTHEQVFPGNEYKPGATAPLTPHHVGAQPLQPGYPQPQQPSKQPQPQQPGSYPYPLFQPQPQQPSIQPQPSQTPFNPTAPGQIPYQISSSVQPTPYQNQPQQSPYQPQSQQPSFQLQPQQTGSQTPYQPQPQLSGQPQQPGFPPQPQQPTTSQPQQQSPTQPQPTPQNNQQPSLSPQPIPGKECGVRRPNQGAKPDEAGFGEFPWHATILSNTNNSALCSAAIIAPNAVITSAHCIEGLNPEDMQIKAGGYTLGQEGPKPAQIREVGAAAIHPSYDSGSLVKDQAIIVTEEPLILDEHIDKVCLAPSSQEEYVPSGGNCFVTGYGRPALQRGTPGTQLHKIKVNLIPKEQCENNLKKTHLGKYFILNKGFTCAAPFKESELCKVDVGSPLVCERPDGHYELAGVYSWDTKCSTALPGVMATCDTQWIQQVLATPVEKLREQYARPQVATHLLIDIDTKPGFALGYGK